MRSSLGDSEFVDVQKFIDNIRNESFIDAKRDRILDGVAFPSIFYGDGTSRTDGGTAHISILAPNGDAVSMTSTING